MSTKHNPLQELFLNELKDIFWAEQHLVKALPKMSKGATSEELKQTIDEHLEQTKGQADRLEKVFNSIGEKAKAVKCEAMDGLLKEAAELLEQTETGTEVRDVAIISACQKVEHYEIASYGTLKALATALGYKEAVKLLNETLSEEKNADNMLTKVGKTVNKLALQETA